MTSNQFPASRRNFLTWAALGAFAVGACGRGGSDADTAVDTAVATAAATDTGVPPTPAPVTVRGIGSLMAGMTVTEARAAVRTFELPAAADSEACTYATVSGLPDGVRVMVEGGRVARIEVDSANVPTLEGARVGDSEARVRELYGDRLSVSPHKYTEGHYLTVRPRDPADSAYRLIFETDGQRVTTFRAGKLPQVAHVERCG